MSSPTGGRGRSPAEHGFWRILKATERSFLYLYDIRLNTKFGERSFSHAGPASWNSLLADLRAISDCSCFKSKNKTYLFQSAFNIQ